MIRLPAMTTNPPMKHTPKRVDSACSHDMPCSFMRRAPTAMSVPGNAKLVAWMLNMPEPIPKGPGHLKPDPDAREQQGHADKVGDGFRGDAQRARDDGGRCHDAEHHGQNVLEGGQQGRAERRMGLEAVNQFAFFFRIGRSGLRGRGAGHRHPPEAWGWEIFAGKTSGGQPRPRAISSGVVPFLTEIRFPCTYNEAPHHHVWQMRQ